MNDRNKRDSIASFATQNGIKLPASFRDGDGTYRGSEEAKKLANRIFDQMDVVVECYFATGEKGTAQKNLSELADMICELDKNAQTKRFAVQGDFEKLSAKIVAPDQSKNDKATIIAYVKQTLEHLPFYVEQGKSGMTPAIGERLEKMLNNTLHRIETEVVDGYSDKANIAATYIANQIVTIRNDLSTGMISTLYVNKYEAELNKRLDEWAALKNAPTPKELAQDQYKIVFDPDDLYSALVEVPEIKVLAEAFFDEIEKMDPTKKYNELKASFNDLKAQYNAKEKEIGEVLDAADNGRISEAEANRRITDIENEKKEINKKGAVLNGRIKSLEVDVEANAPIAASMSMIKDKYELLADGNQYSIFVPIFRPSEFDYNGIIRMMKTNPSPETMLDVQVTISTFAKNLDAREAAAREKAEFFKKNVEERMAKVKNASPIPGIKIQEDFDFGKQNENANENEELSPLEKARRARAQKNGTGVTENQNKNNANQEQERSFSGFGFDN